MYHSPMRRHQYLLRYNASASHPPLQSMTEEKPADEATNHQIVFAGPCGRHRLSLEVDSGESEPLFKQAELETWYEVSPD